MNKIQVVGFAFSADKSKLALVRKKTPAWMAGKLNGIGGKKEEIDATDLDAMCREFREETGVETTAEEWHNFCVHRGDGVDTYFYSMFDDKTLNACTQEAEEILILDVNLDMLRQQGMSNLAWMVAMALDTMQPNFFVEANYRQDFLTGKVTPPQPG